MAKVINFYITYTNQECYTYPDTTGEHSRLEKLAANTQLTIYVKSDGTGPYEENGYYRIRTGTVTGGTHWIYSGYCTALVEDTTTTIDQCLPPESIVLDSVLRSLTIAGGAGGDLNDFLGYQVSWRDAEVGTEEYSEWSADVMVDTTESTIAYEVSAPPGKIRQFRVRTVGSAGEEHYSSYVICETVLLGNTSPDAVVVQFPNAGAQTNSATPVIGIMVPEDADGDTLTIKRKIDSGAWENVGIHTSGLYCDQLPELSIGEHVIAYKTADAYAESSEIDFAIIVLNHSWRRQINTGDVIANENISHVADINEMLDAVNVQRVFYCLPQIELRGTVGRFGDWKPQMEQMIEAIQTTGMVIAKSLEFDVVPSYPTASTINAIRRQLKAF